MRLSAPTVVIFLISVVLAGLVVAVKYAGVSVPVVSGHTFEALAVAYIILLLGNILKGL